MNAITFFPVECNTEAPQCGYAVEPLCNDHHQNQGKCTLERGGPESRGLTLEQLQSQANDIVIIIPYRRGSPESRGLTLEQLHSQANDTVIIVPYRRGGPESRVCLH